VKTPVLDAVARLPVGYYVKIGMERDKEDEHEWLDASLWRVAPPGDNGEGGWPNVHPASQYADRIQWSVSGTTHADTERLLLAALAKELTKL
jgi:hypothetical protein